MKYFEKISNLYVEHKKYNTGVSYRELMQGKGETRLRRAKKEEEKQLLTSVKDSNVAMTRGLFFNKLNNVKANLKNKSLRKVLKVYQQKTKGLTKYSFTIKYTVEKIKLIKYIDGETVEVIIPKYTGSVLVDSLKQDSKDKNFIVTNIYSNLESVFQGQIEQTGSIKWSVSKNNKNDIHKIKNKGEVLKSKLLENINGFEDRGNGYCVIDSIYNQISGKKYYQTLDKKVLCDQFSKICNIEDGISFNDLVLWQKTYGKFINIYALDGLKHIHKSKGEHSVYNLTILLTNKHCTSIENERVKHDITRKGKLELQKIMWDDISNDYVVLQSNQINDLVNGKIEKSVILPEDCDITTLMNDIIRKTGYNIEQFNFRSQSNISGFVHPVSNNLIVANDNYELRKSICDKMINKFNYGSFKNQSITKLSKHLFRILIGDIKESTYNDESNKIFDIYSPSAITQGFLSEYKNAYGIDNFKSYSTVLFKNKLNIPIYNVLCSWEDYDDRDIVCGEYFIDCKIKYGFELFGVYSWNLVKYLMDNKLIKKESIKKMFLPCGELKYEMFNKFVETVYQTFTEKEGKNLINMLIGNFGTKYNKTISGCITDDEYEAYALHARHPNIQVFPFNNLFLVKQNSKERLLEDSTSINRFVVSGGIINLLESLKYSFDKDSRLIAIRTDCVYIENPRFPEEIIVDKKANVLYNLGRVKIEDEIHLVRVNDEINKYTVNEIFEDIQKDIVKGNGTILNGMAGCGKTEKGKEMYKEYLDKKCGVLCFTNKACNVIRERFKKDEIPTDDIFTICKFFNEEQLPFKKRIEKLCKYDFIWIDEISTAPTHIFNAIYKAWQIKKFKLVLSGDILQLPSIQNEKKYNLIENDAVLQMCPDSQQLQYIENCGRYDIKTKNMLDYFVEHGKLNVDISDIGYTEINICKSNKTRQTINKHCDDRQTGEVKSFTYQKKQEEYKVYDGMSVMCTENLYDINFYNGELFKVDKIIDSVYHINDKEFKEDEFLRCFIPSYCITVSKYQGDKIDFHYNIFDTEKMSANELYTALSRTTRFEYIHLESQKLRKEYFFHDYDDEENTIYNARKNKYSEGKIYVVKYNEKYYIGSTTENKIETRLSEHIKCKQSPLFGAVGAEISLLTSVSVYNRQELEEIEAVWIHRYIKEHGKDKMLNKNYCKSGDIIIKPRVEIKKVIKHKYKIEDYPKQGYFRIKWMDERKSKQIIRRYNPENKEEKLNEMKAKQNELLNWEPGLILTF